MKKLRNLEPATAGIALFGLALITLLALIVVSRLGMINLANTLVHVAQPISSCAIAVLTYLAIIEMKPESVE